MHTLGSTFVPPGFHAGGLRYHGMAPMVSHLVDLGLVNPRAYGQLECFQAGVDFAKAEGILPAPEANHAVAAAIAPALPASGSMPTIRARGHSRANHRAAAGARNAAHARVQRIDRFEKRFIAIFLRCLPGLDC